MAENNLINSPIPFTVAKGGTGVTTNTTAYGLLTAGVTATGAIQNAGTGTAGQVYVSGGPSALGSWGSGPAGGSFLIATFTASAQATLDITGITGYYQYYISVDSLVPATGNAALRIRTSSDNGSSFDAGSTDYASVTAGTTAFNDNATDHIRTSTQSSGTESDGGISGYIRMINPASTSKFCSLLGHLGCPTNGTGPYMGLLFGARNSAADVDAIRFYFSTGNITSGTVKLYGIVT